MLYFEITQFILFLITGCFELIQIVQSFILCIEATIEPVVTRSKPARDRKGNNSSCSTDIDVFVVAWTFQMKLLMVSVLRFLLYQLKQHSLLNQKKLTYIQQHAKEANSIGQKLKNI